MAIEVISLKEKLSRIKELWQPRVIGEVNDFHIKLAKLKGEFVWHKHDEEDELFLVIKGSLVVKTKEGDLHISEGELVVIPKGTMHMPVGEEEVHLLVVEPKSTLNTGDVRNENTIDELEWI